MGNLRISDSESKVDILNQHFKSVFTAEDRNNIPDKDPSCYRKLSKNSPSLIIRHPLLYNDMIFLKKFSTYNTLFSISNN